MVELGDSAIGAKVTAEFDGKRLKVTVLKRRESVYAAGGQTSPNKSRTRGSLSMGAVTAASGAGGTGWHGHGHAKPSGNGNGSGSGSGQPHGHQANGGASDFSHGLASGSEHWSRSGAGHTMPLSGDGSTSRRHSPQASMSLPTQHTRTNSAMQSSPGSAPAVSSATRTGQRYVATNWGL